MNNNQLKLEVHDIYKKDEKLTTSFKAVKDTDIVSQAYLDEKVIKIPSHLSFLEKDYNEVILPYNKQSVEEILVQRVVKTTIQMLYDKGRFDIFPNADTVLKDCFCLLHGLFVVLQRLFVRKPILYSLTFNQPPGPKINKEPWIKYFKKINKSVLSPITFYLEDDDHKPVDFNNETITFTCQEIKI